MPSFYEIKKLGIASRLFVQLETKTFKTKVQLVWLVSEDCHFVCEYFINAIIWWDKQKLWANRKLKVDYLCNQKRKPLKQKLNRPIMLNN